MENVGLISYLGISTLLWRLAFTRETWEIFRKNTLTVSFIAKLDAYFLPFANRKLNNRSI